MNAQEDAASHQGRMCAIAHAKLVARDAIACRQELMATKMCAPATLINEHTEISPSVLRERFALFKSTYTRVIKQIKHATSV